MIIGLHIIFLNQGHVSLSSLCQPGSSRMGCYQRIHVSAYFHIDHFFFSLSLYFLYVWASYTYFSQVDKLIGQSWAAISASFIAFVVHNYTNFNTIYFLYRGWLRACSRGSGMGCCSWGRVCFSPFSHYFVVLFAWSWWGCHIPVALALFVAPPLLNIALIYCGFNRFPWWYNK